jgi:peptide chain release factor subunit 1
MFQVRMRNYLYIFIILLKFSNIGIVLAGSAELKNDLLRNDHFERLKESVVHCCDVSYGMEQGLKEAIRLSANTLVDSRLATEKHLLRNFFQELSKDSGLYCYGAAQTMKVNTINSFVIS